MKTVELSALAIDTLLSDGWTIYKIQHESRVERGIEKGASKIELTKKCWELAFAMERK